ncbi:MAG TPA: hypothetical protein VML75_15335 [Kofleriaceae bacterium]|nr:hypothetical protein [Kofleriaceae bacterium]
MRTATLLTAAFMFSACATTGSTVQVKGKDVEIVELAGEWTGDYKGIESGREGRITFNLGLGRHTADGEVLMYAANSDQAHSLPIQFVQVDDGRVSGKIGPYLDPACKCEVETEFLGDLHGDVIDGTFVTRIASLSSEQTGLWSVSRND